MLHALLCIKMRANQVICGVVINLLSVSLTAFLTNQINASVFGKPSNKLLLAVSPRFDVPLLSKIPLLGVVFRSVYPFEFIIVAVALLAWYVLYKTPYGMRLRACGDNPHAVDAAGGNVSRIRFSAVMVSKDVAGLGGYELCLLHLHQLLFQHLYGLWLACHCCPDLWKLEDSPNLGCLSDIRLCPFKWVCPHNFSRASQ